MFVVFVSCSVIAFIVVIFGDCHCWFVVVNFIVVIVSIVAMVVIIGVVLGVCVVIVVVFVLFLL